MCLLEEAERSHVDFFGLAHDSSHHLLVEDDVGEVCFAALGD